ncbi:hypothetical protein LJC45_00030 [Alistipes sp. OttesenSCG-928-B03]|nr:hypothetical protein [Alistipes sp. OttesenSCG-928-B03]
MKKYRISAIPALLCLSALTLQGCYEDKGNYDYTPAQEIIIGNIESEYYRVLLEDTISVSPILYRTVNGISTQFEPEGWDSEWILMGERVDGVMTNHHVFSTEDELHKHPLNLSKGDHLLVYKITDPLGISYFSDVFKVKVESELGRGMLIMCDVNGKTRLDHLNYFNHKITPVYDVIKLTKSDAPLDGAPVSVNCYFDSNAPVNGSGFGSFAVTMMTDLNAFHLNAADFSYIPEYELRSQFVIEPPSYFRPSKIIMGRGESYPLNMGFMSDPGSKNLYYYSTMMVPASFWSETNIANKFNGVRFNASPHATWDQMSSVIFNDDTKSFYRFSLMMKMTFAYGSDLSNLGKDLVFVHQQSGQQVVAVMKSSAGAYSIMRFDAATGNNVKTYDLNLPDADKIQGFAMQWVNMFGYLYYYTEDKVYAINLASISDPTDSTITVVYPTKDTPEVGGPKISGLKYVRNGSSGSEATWRDNLMVFTYDPKLPSESCGTITMYKAQPNGELKVAELEDTKMTFGGFGKIVDADYKIK